MCTFSCLSHLFTFTFIPALANDRFSRYAYKYKWRSMCRIFCLVWILYAQRIAKCYVFETSGAQSFPVTFRLTPLFYTIDVWTDKSASLLDMWSKHRIKQFCPLHNIHIHTVYKHKRRLPKTEWNVMVI